jgi:hypothetical protein
MAEELLQKYLNRFGQIKDIKKYWDSQFQEIGENIFIRKQDFSSSELKSKISGQFLNEDLFDNSAYDALDDFSGALLSDLWDKGPGSVKINPPADIRLDKKKLSTELKNFYDRLNVKKDQVMGHNEAGLAVALDEYMMECCGFGTGGIAVIENENDDTVPVRYESWDIKSMYIDEGKGGKVDTVHVLRGSTVRKVVDEYGIKNVHENVRKLYKEGKYTDSVDVLEIIEPRNVYTVSAKRNNKQKPVASVHIDYTNRYIMKESGFDEFPVVVARFAKLVDETWGRCPSFLALPTIRDANILAESIIRAQEKNLDPPLGVLDDGTLGRGTLDTSAGAISTIRYNSRLANQKPVFSLNEVQDIPSAYNRLNDLVARIAKFYKLDKLMDIEGTGKTHRTVPEAVIRDGKMAKPLFKIYNRQEHETFVPLIEKTINIIMKRGLAGVKKGSQLEHSVYVSKGKDPVYLPEEIVRRIENNEDFYELQFLTPARRKRDVEELQSIQSTASVALELAQVDPSYADYYNFDEAQKAFILKSGVPLQIMRSDDDVQKIRDARANQQAQMSQIEMADKAADIGVKNAQVAAVRQKQMKGIQ